MKLENRKLLQARAERALRDLYHNATVTYPREQYGRADDYFEQWFSDLAQFEIEYLQDGGSTPRNYRATLAAPCNAGQFKSEAAQRYYIAKGMRDRDLERADCGTLTGWRVFELMAGNTTLARRLNKIRKAHGPLNRHNALWECITDYGTLYQWGRGGRTLAPEDLIKQCGGDSFRIREPEGDNETLTRMIQIVESFNRYVSNWCASVPEQWREHCAEEDAEIIAAKKCAAAKKGKETRERHYWEARDLATA